MSIRERAIQLSLSGRYGGSSVRRVRFIGWVRCRVAARGRIRTPSSLIDPPAAEARGLPHSSANAHPLAPGLSTRRSRQPDRQAASPSRGFWFERGNRDLAESGSLIMIALQPLVKCFPVGREAGLVSSFDGFRGDGPTLTPPTTGDTMSPARGERADRRLSRLARPLCLDRTF